MFDITAVLDPFEGDNPAGENLRYTQVYDDIGQARKEDDALDRGDWEREIKTAEWDKVRRLAVEALTEKSKDLQIAVWLAEALVRIEGFPGLCRGLEVIVGLLEHFWDCFYPEAEDGDLDYRVGPLEFMNEKMWLPIKQVSLTDPGTTPGYSLINYQESLQVGSESDDSSDEKIANRQTMMAEGKPSIDQFDAAVAKSSKIFYKALQADIEACLQAFNRFDELIDERFGKDAPRTAELKEALDACSHFIAKTLKSKLAADPDSQPIVRDAAARELSAEDQRPSVFVATAQGGGGATPVPEAIAGAAAVADTQSHETGLWNAAVMELNVGGLKKALDMLFAASLTSVSLRDRTRFRLMMAQMCLGAGRIDLARPIGEELNTMIEEYGLQRWESPVWIADVMGVLYKCLNHADAGEDDAYRAEEILKKIITIDVTKAMQYKS